MTNYAVTFIGGFSFADAINNLKSMDTTGELGFKDTDFVFSTDGDDTQGLLKNNGNPQEYLNKMLHENPTYNGAIMRVHSGHQNKSSMAKVEQNVVKGTRKWERLYEIRLEDGFAPLAWRDTKDEAITFAKEYTAEKRIKTEVHQVRILADRISLAASVEFVADKHEVAGLYIACTSVAGQFSDTPVSAEPVADTTSVWEEKAEKAVEAGSDFHKEFEAVDLAFSSTSVGDFDDASPVEVSEDIKLTTDIVNPYLLPSQPRSSDFGVELND